jgi:7-cyano-7-deazaguanine reductase
VEGRFLDSSVPAPERLQFEALGNAGSEHYKGLELFPNPGCAAVRYSSDEVVAHCPVTGQPDFYVIELTLLETEHCIESKSLKLWLRQFNDPKNGIFCEALAVYIRDQVAIALGYVEDLPRPPIALDEEAAAEHVKVILTQKARGGISIRAVA